MAKAGREKIELESTAGTGSFLYDNEEQADDSLKRSRLSSFDPKARKHVPYKEAKIK